MRKFVQFTGIALFYLLLALPAYGQSYFFQAMIIDSDPKGTNVRDSPNGKVVRVIPHEWPEPELRLVVINGQEKDWFKVHLFDDYHGWMHRSVLGTCAVGTEDGDPYLKKEPREAAAIVARVKSGTPLDLLEVRDDWVKVSYADASGKKNEGWLEEQCTLSNPFEDCRNSATPRDSITIRNESQDFTLISFTLIEKDKRNEVDLQLDPGQTKATSFPRDTQVDVDCYMGMPNNIHFLFKGVSFSGIVMDTLVVRDSEGSGKTDQFRPVLEAQFGGKKTGSFAGAMTYDDMR